MKEIDLIIRNSNKLSQLNKLFKLIWQEKKCCGNKSWIFFFLQCINKFAYFFLNF